MVKRYSINVRIPTNESADNLSAGEAFYLLYRGAEVSQAYALFRVMIQLDGNDDYY